MVDRVGANSDEEPGEGASGEASTRSDRRIAETADAAQTASGDATDDQFLTELGQRVRRSRGLRGMSRKVLARTSGISERYIAQLESGMGNVSIVLLRRLARATGVALDDFVSDAPAGVAVFRDLLRHASPQQIEQAKAVLRGETSGLAPAGRRGALDRIALIGLRGAGKSTLGRMAAERLGWSFVELNKEIERSSGFSVTEIFKLYGQEGYRRAELKALREIAERREPMILATGGGIVAEPVTFELLLSAFFTVWVKATPEEHMNRVRQQGDLRPMANDRAAMEELVTILSSREPLYGRARAIIDTSGRSVEAALADLLALVESYCEVGCPFVSNSVKTGG